LRTRRVREPTRTTVAFCWKYDDDRLWRRARTRSKSAARCPLWRGAWGHKFGRRRPQVRLEPAAGQLAPGTGDEPGATAEIEGLGDERLGVDRDPCLAGSKDEAPEAPTAVADEERVLERAVGTLELEARGTR
jgi:hypothetical protein